MAVSHDMWILRLNPDGSLRWQKRYHLDEYNVGTSIKEKPDGSFWATGLWGPEFADTVCLLKLDESGNILWQRSYTNYSGAKNITSTPDGGYMFAGCNVDSEGNNQDIFICKLDSEGSIQWQKQYKGPQRSYSSPNIILQTNDSGIILGGEINQSEDEGYCNLLLIKLDANGNTVWQRIYGGTEQDFLYSITELSYGGYIVAASTGSFGGGGYDAWILKLLPNGEIVWQRTYGGYEDDSLSGIKETQEGGFIMTGRTSSFNSDAKDISDPIWVLKVNQEGLISESCSAGIGKITDVQPVETPFETSDISITTIDKEAEVYDTSINPMDREATTFSISFICSNGT